LEPVWGFQAGISLIEEHAFYVPRSAFFSIKMPARTKQVNRFSGVRHPLAYRHYRQLIFGSVGLQPILRRLNARGHSHGHDRAPSL